ncbi:helix-turn-helix transcriptional regulator [Streptomyces sp. NPDC046203]|uniref:helix-turn-helix domain-containing protein n=1 Tax=Streptomyces sp. NPDC046203 TaxID=3154602 RepID=UPI0033E3AFB2
MTRGETAPGARGARSPAEFVARLQALKDHSGLTYRQLSARAEARGDVLPRSAVADMLARSTVPRAELLAAFLRACGVPPEAAAEWEAIRRDVALRARGAPQAGAAGASGVAGGSGDPGAGGMPVGAGEPPDPGESGEPDDAGDSGDSGESGEPGNSPPVWPMVPDPAPDPGRASGGVPVPARARLRRFLVVAVAVATLVTATLSIVVFLREGDRARRNPPVLTAPAEGPVRIRVIGSDLCLGERRDGRGGPIYQRPCTEAAVPRYALEQLDDARWRIVSHHSDDSGHPGPGPGCSGLPSGDRPAEAVLEDSACGDPTRVERFTVESYGTPVTGYRIRPDGQAEPGSCVTVLGDPRAEWSRLGRSPCREDARGQLFSFDRRT